jgi:hypothetical protein
MLWVDFLITWGQQNQHFGPTSTEIAHGLRFRLTRLADISLLRP